MRRKVKLENEVSEGKEVQMESVDGLEERGKGSAVESPLRLKPARRSTLSYVSAEALHFVELHGSCLTLCWLIPMHVQLHVPVIYDYIYIYMCEYLISLYDYIL